MSKCLENNIDSILDNKISLRAINQNDKIHNFIVNNLKYELNKMHQLEKELMQRRDARGGELAYHLSKFWDITLKCLFEKFMQENKDTDINDFTVIAIGGYGRQSLAPYSDIDLLFLLENSSDKCPPVLEAVLYFLWDAGLKIGYAIRSIDECIEQAEKNFTVKTSLLDSRFVWGARELFDDYIKEVFLKLFKGREKEFITQRFDEREKTLKKAGSSRYLVEPDLKNSKGGLRDLQSLMWLSKSVFGNVKSSDFTKLGIFNQVELGLYTKAYNFLWKVRFHLHYTSGTARDILTFDDQVVVASSMGYKDSKLHRGVMQFMSNYFRVVKDVGVLTGIFSGFLEQYNYKHPFQSDEISGKKLELVSSNLPANIYILQGRITMKAGIRTKLELACLFFDIFRWSIKYDIQINPNSITQISRSKKIFDNEVRKSSYLAWSFLEILQHKNGHIALRKMNDTGVLGSYIASFAKVVGRTQFSLYHRYTVDEHLIKTVENLSKIEHQYESIESEFENSLLNSLSINDKLVLYVAAFLHDIAKSSQRDHSQEGAKIAYRISRKLGIDTKGAELVSWLVKYHLLLSHFAQTKDINELKSITFFADKVKEVRKLDLLFLLTVVDIMSVGPGVWTKWKKQLITELYKSARHCLLSGSEKLLTKVTVDKVIQDIIAVLLKDKSLDMNTLDAEKYVSLFRSNYLLSTDSRLFLNHARLLDVVRKQKKIMESEVSEWKEEQVVVISLCVEENYNFFIFVTRVCSKLEANIVSAQVFSTIDDKLIVSLFVEREYEDILDDLRKAYNIVKAVKEIVKSDQYEVIEPNKMASLGGDIKSAFKLEAEVRIDNNISENSTVIEVSCADRLGLLFDITSALNNLGLHIVAAHVATYGERVVDSFYVTNLSGGKVIEKELQTPIVRSLCQTV